MEFRGCDHPEDAPDTVIALSVGQPRKDRRRAERPGRLESSFPSQIGWAALTLAFPGLRLR